MAGLAATMDAPDTMDRLVAALEPRGPDSSVCRLDGAAGARIDVAVRAVLPHCVRVVAPGTGHDSEPVAVIVIDGIASASQLDAGYAERGPAGLLGGDEPYAAIFADAQRECLVLARNGDGPGLYYAAYGRGWVVASEPTALLGAGVAAYPDTDVIRRFIDTGDCDDGEVTFFAGIRRLLANEAVVLSRDTRLRRYGLRRPPAGQLGAGRAVAQTLAGAVEGRVAVRLAPGVPSAALLATALTRPGQHRQLPVQVTTWAAQEDTVDGFPAVLIPLPPGTVKTTTHALTPATLDLSAFLRDVGEPVPDVDMILSWEVARCCAGGTVDTIVDASVAATSHCVSRVHDRLTARYGVGLRSPLRGCDAYLPATSAVLANAMPASIGRYATEDVGEPVGAKDILLGIRDDVTATLAAADVAKREWAGDHLDPRALRRLADGEPVDVEILFRLYLVERWLRDVVEPLRGANGAGAGRRQPEPVEMAGAIWSRIPIRTEAFRPGDRVVGRSAWHVAHAIAEDLVNMSGDGRRPGRPIAGEKGASPWLAVLSAKPLAVSQHRICPLWDVKPTWLARTLAKLAPRCQERLATPWTMQVALDDGGLVRVCAAILAGGSGLIGLSRRLLPAPALALSGPRASAVGPADAAVVRVPLRPNEAAASLVDSFRLTLSTELVDTLIGCAVVATDSARTMVLGYACGPGATLVPGAAHVPTAMRMVERLCLDDPAGAGRELTPVVIAVRLSGNRLTPATGVAKVPPARAVSDGLSATPSPSPPP